MGYLKQAWSHTSAQMALLANLHRDPKKRSTPFSADDFNPFVVKSKPKGEPLDVDTLHIIRDSIRARKRREGRI